TVLELAGGKTLCVQVSNFFELERAFECDGKADVAAQEEHGGGIVKRGGKRRHGVFAVDDGLDLVGHCAQVGQDGFDFIGEHIPAQLREVKTQHIGGGNLCQKGLGGGHGDFGAGVGIQRGVGFAWD